MRATAATASESDRAQRALLAADIKRFLERPSADPVEDHAGRAGAAGRAHRRPGAGLAAPPAQGLAAPRYYQRHGEPPPAGRDCAW